MTEKPYLTQKNKNILIIIIIVSAIIFIWQNFQLKDRVVKEILTELYQSKHILNGGEIDIIIDNELENLESEFKELEQNKLENLESEFIEPGIGEPIVVEPGFYEPEVIESEQNEVKSTEPEEYIEEYEGTPLPGYPFGSPP